MKVLIIIFLFTCSLGAQNLSKLFDNQINSKVKDNISMEELHTALSEYSSAHPSLIFLYLQYKNQFNTSFNEELTEKYRQVLAFNKNQYLKKKEQTINDIYIKIEKEEFKNKDKLVKFFDSLLITITPLSFMEDISITFEKNKQNFYIYKFYKNISKLKYRAEIDYKIKVVEEEIKIKRKII